MTSNSKADGRFGKRDFVYIARDDEYRCPAGQRVICASLDRRTRDEDQRLLDTRLAQVAHSSASARPAKERRIRRWEHEAVLDAMQRRLDRKPDAMKVRRRTVEHIFGTLKALDGIDALPHENTGQRPHRDEFARSCLQPETRYADTRHCGDNESDKDSGSVSAICASTRTCNAFQDQVIDEAAQNASGARRLVMLDALSLTIQAFPHSLDPMQPPGVSTAEL